MNEYDVFDNIIETYGSPADRIEVSDAIIAAFRNRIPARLLEFWRSYGWGSWVGGFSWLCDPRPFDDLLKLLFNDDLEFSATDITVVAYTALCQLKAWNVATGSTILINLNKSDVFPQPAKALIDSDTSKPFSKAFLIGLLLQDDLDLISKSFDLATERLGRLARGEVFGYVPALQLGGRETVEDLQKVSAIEHMHFLAQLEPLKVTRLSEPRPGFPYGQMEVVRAVGRS